MQILVEIATFRLTIPIATAGNGGSVQQRLSAAAPPGLLPYWVGAADKLYSLGSMTDAPIQVKRAVALLWTSFAITVLDLIVNAEPLSTDDPKFEAFFYIATAFLYLITSVLIYFIYRRRNWARIVYLALTAVTIAAYVIWPIECANEQWWVILLAIVQVVLDVVALYWLFIGRGAGWYSKSAVE